MAKKSFFKEKSEKEIRELNLRTVFSKKGLVEKILELNPASEGLEIRVQLLPGQFYRNTQSWKQASNKALKHGGYIPLSQPTTITEALKSRRLPHQIRKADFGQLDSIHEDEINLIGYSFKPIQGVDRRKRLVPFSWIMEGARIFAYSERLKKGIEVKPYDDAAKVEQEGADVIVIVPSRKKRQRRYTIRFKHVPIIDNQRKRAICWSLDTNFERGEEPRHKTFNIRYRFEHDREGSDVKVFYPHEIAGYLAIAKHYAAKEGNRVPWDMNPFAKPSQKLVDFYKRITNNVVIYDPTLGKSGGTRKIHIAEECLLLGRAVRALGHDKTLFWNPERDPKTLADYDWTIPQVA